MTAEHAGAIVDWEYEGVYRFYNLTEDIDDLEEFLDVQNWRNYRGVVDDNDHLVGFFTFFKADKDTIEIGLGLRPDLTGGHLGRDFVIAGMNYAIERYRPKGLFLSVAAFNHRAQKVYEGLGFSPVESYWERINGQGFEFIKMMKDIET